TRAHPGPLSRQLRRHPRAGPPGAPSPRADQLPRRVGRHHQRLDHRRAPVGGADAEIGDVDRGDSNPVAVPGARGSGFPGAPRLQPGEQVREMSQQQAMPGARYVDPKILARIGNLELLARNVVEGFINGLHRAPYFGASIDFAEHRGYVAGDDIRRVDWRLYGRTDRYYVKQYEADTNTNLSVLLDVSGSMKFSGRGVPKIQCRR